jgi:hypothetical protein
LSCRTWPSRRVRHQRDERGQQLRASTGTVTLKGVGTFELSPTEATVVADELLLYRCEWVHPTFWRDLATLQLRFVPLLLTARAGGKPTDAIYETPSGVRPIVRATVKSRDPETGLIEFSIKVDRASMPVRPALCAGDSPATTALRTSFGLHDGSGASLGVDLTLPWRCLGTELKTP